MAGGNNSMLTQGGVYLVKLNPSKRDEVGKVRPSIVLTNQEILESSPPVVFICPLSSKSKAAFRHVHLEIPPRDSLKKKSFALIEHCRSISVERISSKRLAMLAAHEIHTIIQRFALLVEY